MNVSNDNNGEDSATSFSAQRVGVTLKLPQYWSKDPILWFAQVEAQFSIANIKSEETKFHHVISCLPPEAATEVRDLILKPPSNPYSKLKEALVVRTSESAAQRIKKALDATEFGDTRPTQILRLLEQQLEGLEPNSVLLMQVFLQKLPVTVRSIVAANSDKIPLTELAELADRVYDNLPPTVGINKVSRPESPSTGIDERMSRLELMMEKLLSNNNGEERTFHRKHSRSKSRGRFNPNGSLCFYHWRYRELARKCNPPCKWQESASKN